MREPPVRSVLLVVLFVVAPLLVSAGAAAQGDGSVRLSFSPDHVTLLSGANMTATLLVENPTDRAVAVRLEGAVESGVRGVISQRDVKVEPQGAMRVPVAVHAAPDAAPGDRALLFRAVSSTNTAAESAPAAEVKLLVTVADHAATDAARPIVTPAKFDVAVPPDAVRVHRISVENPSNLTAKYEVRVDAPAAWDVRPLPPRFTLAPGETRAVEISFRTLLNATAGNARLFVGTPGAFVPVDVALRVGPSGVRPDGGTLVPAPLGLRLSVEPREMSVPPGGVSTGVVLLVANDGRTAHVLSFEVDLPSGATALVGDGGPVEVAPGARLRLPLTVEVEVDQPLGAILDGRVRAVGVDVAPALFRLRVAAAPVGGSTVAADESDAARDVPYGAVAAAVAIAGGAVLAFNAARRKWPWLLAALYTRLMPNRMLEHPLRERIVQEVRATPGITFSELQRNLDVALGMVTHHTRMLERSRVIFSSPDGQLRRFYPIEGGRVESVADLGTRALELLSESGPLSAAELARRLGVSRQALHHHVKKLVASGALEAHPDGLRRVKM